jgi:hypothetical protein
MSEPRPAPPRLSDTQDTDLVQYRALSSLAVTGLVLGLLSPLAVLGPLLWIIPAAGALVSSAALWRISRPAAALAGRRLAECGLLLSIVFGTAVGADAVVYRFLVRQEARRFAAMWFGYLLQSRPPEPQKAYSLTIPPQLRQASDQLADHYRRNPRRRETMETYLQTPLVRKLLALGPGARVRYDGCDNQSSSDEGEQVELIYAVIPAGGNGQTTFLVRLELARLKLESGRANWQLVNAEIKDKGS